MRKRLAGKKRYNKLVDMEWVYQELDKGRTVKSVAEELQISESTLRRRHHEYQAQLQIEEEVKMDENEFLLPPPFPWEEEEEK